MSEEARLITNIAKVFVMTIFIYTPKFSKRLEYITNFIFKQLWNMDVVISSQSDDFSNYLGVKINYSYQNFKEKGLCIRPHSLLFETNIQAQNINVQKTADYPFFFAHSDASSLHYDPFACIFYMLSRYEEYLDFEPDTHQRFPASASIAAHANFLHLPVVELWVQSLYKAIKAVFNNFSIPSSSYRFHPTYDIDIPWAYKHRGIRGLARAGLDVAQAKWAVVKERFKVMTGLQQDPFFTFAELEERHKHYAIRPFIFWLVADRAPFDINPNTELKAFQTLIQACSTWSDTGLHPSYRSNQVPECLSMEKNRLEKISNQDIRSSRQHFLCLRFPHTYQHLIAAGIEHDYSMGFADRVGYRAGTTHSFLWYDLANEQITNLRVHPFVAMDVSLRKYNNLDATAAQAELKQLQAYCKKHQLTFRTLWHNSSFADQHEWAGWRAAYWSLFE